MMCLLRGLRPHVVTIALLFAVCAPNHAHADSAFNAFLESLWPRAQQIGVSRKVFDAGLRGLEPDLTLPDLDIPGRPASPPPGQAEFVQTPGQYLRESSFDRLAARGRELSVQHRATLARIEKGFGVPGNVVLAIWARETDYGSYKLPYDALRVLATQAYFGKRAALFQAEFLYALKMIQDGTPRADMRSSWGGALGMTQFLPSEFYKLGVDFDGDGRADIFRSVPDALASAAKAGPAPVQPGADKCYGVALAGNITAANEAALSFTPAKGRKLSPKELSLRASLLQPEGNYGPSFLTPKNYFVIKEYNFSDLYVLFVGHLSDRIAGAGPFETAWSKSDQLKTKDVEAMQQRLIELGIYKDKIDGKAGMLTRAALGQYQKANGLKVDCWPTAAVLSHMRR